MQYNIIQKHVKGDKHKLGNTPLCYKRKFTPMIYMFLARVVRPLLLTAVLSVRLSLRLFVRPLNIHA